MNEAQLTALKAKVKPLLANKKVLLVDDMSLNRDNYREIMSALGVAKANIFESGNGLQALDVLKQHQVEVIVTDWNMPFMSGQMLVREIRKFPEHQDTLIFMVTAEDDKDVETVRPYIQAFLKKPFTWSTVEKMVVSVLAKHWILNK